ncbi:MAG: PAS domain S-box protein [Leptolyngbyaceae cyanobacterium]
MSLVNKRLFDHLSIDQILDPQPLIVAPHVAIKTVLEQMSQTFGQICDLAEIGTQGAQTQSPKHFGCALIVADNQLLGILTERDLVRLVAMGADLATVAIADVMTHPVITLKRSEAHSLFTVMAILKQHQIRQLPIVDDSGMLLGLVTQTSIRRALQPFNFLKLRRVGEIMTQQVIQAAATENLLELAQRMTHHRVSCIVITQAKPQGGLRLEAPIGIVTERDIVQFQALGLPLAQTPAQTVMSTPLFLAYPQDTLWSAHQEMQRRHTRRLVVANEAGGVAGIVTQTNLLQMLDPVEMLTEIEQLQQVSEAQTAELEAANQQLHQTNQALQTEIAERQRLETVLRETHQSLEERFGVQAARLVQTDAALQHEVQERHQAQAQLETFFSVTPSLLCIAGLDGYFKRLNPNFSKILGYDEAELLASPFTSFIHPDDLAATRAEIENLAAGQLSIAFVNRYRCQNGSYRWFSWYATASFEEQLIYAAARDVTAQKHLEDDLRQERNFTSAVLDTVGALVIVLDRTGQIVRFNQTCEQVSGYAASEALGQTIWDMLIPPPEKAAVQAVFQQVSQVHSPNQYENYWVCRDGTHRLISWSNTVLKDAADAVEYVIGTGIDVTEQRQIEQALARQYQQAQLLSEITRRIRESLEISEVLQTAATEVRALLACDRVLIIEFDSPTTGKVIQEAMPAAAAAPSVLHQGVSGLQLRPETTALACACADLQRDCSSPGTAAFLKQWGAQACIEIVIHVGEQLWGLLTVMQCDRPRQWEAFEIELLQQLANQMGVAIAQAQLLNNLEAQVQRRSQQLIQTNQQLRQEIQDRVQTENALRESQQKLAGILDNADEAIISIDSQQRIVMYNQGAEQIFGYTFDEIHHQPLDILLPAAFQQVHRQHVQNFSIAADTSRQMANRSRDVLGQRKTGETFPAEASISKLQTNHGQQLFTVILKDITQRRQTEAALRRSEEQLRLTTNALPVLICSVDAEQRYVFNNRTYEDWYQIPLTELPGQYIWQVMGDAYYAQAKPHIEAALSGREASFEAELTTPDGQSRYLLTTYIPEVDTAQGHIKGFFGLTNDISDRKAAERMKDEFVSIVGHELRTPLTSIHGSLVLLASKKLGNLTPQGQEFLEISLKNTQRLSRLINDVLDLERIESGRVTMSLQTCDLGDLMWQAAQAMQSMADEHHIHFAIAPGELTAWADADHILQVLTNLLSNAIKFSPAHTTISLSAAKRNHDILIQVQDQGRGIPSNQLETIFERFQQVDASDSRQLGGTGLGLAICKNIVQRHGGKIWAESTLGIGSTFCFTLPDIR